MKNINICEAFAKGDRKLKTQHLFIEGNVLYSYGYHFPLAIRLVLDNDFKFVVNKDKYSRTTSRHKSEFMRFISEDDIIKESDTYEMKMIADSKVESVKELMALKLESEAIKI